MSTLLQKWRLMEDYPDFVSASDEYKEEMRKAFYAGALAFIATDMEIARDSETQKEYEQGSMALVEECRAFAAMDAMKNMQMPH